MILLSYSVLNYSCLAVSRFSLQLSRGLWPVWPTNQTRSKPASIPLHEYFSRPFTPLIYGAHWSVISASSQWQLTDAPALLFHNQSIIFFSWLSWKITSYIQRMQCAKKKLPSGNVKNVNILASYAQLIMALYNYILSVWDLLHCM